MFSLDSLKLQTDKKGDCPLHNDELREVYPPTNLNLFALRWASTMAPDKLKEPVEKELADTGAEKAAM